MPDDTIERAESVLTGLMTQVQEGQQVDAKLLERVREALDVNDVGRSYALVTQPLCKVLEPSVDIRNLASGWSFSPRTTVCKAVVVPFNDSLGRPLKKSDDPYVSNPLRSGLLGSNDWKAERRASDLKAWQPILALLDEVESSADPESAAQGLLSAVVARLMELAVNPSSLISEMLEIQAAIKTGSDLFERRRDLLVGKGTRLMEKLADDLGLGLSVEASTGMGKPAEVPWLRFYDPEHSPSATTGEYLVYLFAADGSAAYLCLIVGTEGTGLDRIDARVSKLRAELGENDDLLREVDLRSVQGGGRPRGYEHGSIYAKRYAADGVPTDEDLAADLKMFAALLSRLEEVSPEDPGGLLHRLTLEAVRDALGDLVIPDRLLLDAIAALRAGKHLLLTGPPGTGKTTLGQALADAARAVGICEGWTTVTAVATWTTYDTVGGYQQKLDGSLEFAPGSALRAIDANEWLVIDELNRADIDKALGSLFTVLSGQFVELTLNETLPDGSQVPVTIAPADSPSPTDRSTHIVQPGWRLIATMNTWDQDLLFTMSYALLRRFAVIHVDPPEADDLVSLVGEVEPIEDIELATAVASLATTPHIRLGPAILRATARFVKERQDLALPDEAGDDLLMSALTSEVVPQLSHLSPEELAEVARHLSNEVLRTTPSAAVRAYLEKHIGVSIPESSSGDPAPEDPA